MIKDPDKTLFTQLKERKVFRVAIAYTLVGWVLMQVGEVTSGHGSLIDGVFSKQGSGCFPGV